MSCSVDGCGNAVYARGLCEKHYQRMRLTGTTNAGKRPRGPLKERFLSRLKRGKDDECWDWDGAVTGQGYGVIQEAGKGSRLLTVHRLSYEHHHGPIPAGMLVLHSCDNRRCVNPKHLRVGDQSENIREAYAKGRKSNPIAHGEQNPKSKLTLEEVKFIKAHPELPHTELAKLFGLSPNCIRGVRNGRTWKDA